MSLTVECPHFGCGIGGHAKGCSKFFSLPSPEPQRAEASDARPISKGLELAQDVLSVPHMSIVTERLLAQEVIRLSAALEEANTRRLETVAAWAQAEAERDALRKQLERAGRAVTKSLSHPDPGVRDDLASRVPYQIANNVEMLADRVAAYRAERDASIRERDEAKRMAGDPYLQTPSEMREDLQKAEAESQALREQLARVTELGKKQEETEMALQEQVSDLTARAEGAEASRDHYRLSAVALREQLADKDAQVEALIAHLEHVTHAQDAALRARVEKLEAALRDIVEDSRGDGPINAGLDSIQAAEALLSKSKQEETK